MTSAIATMPSSTSSGSTEHRRSDSEAGPRGFTAVNIPSPPTSREGSAVSPDVSPRHGSANAGRQGNSSNFYAAGHESANQKRRRSTSSDQGPLSPRRYDYHPPKKVDTQQQQQLADRALYVLDTTNQQPSNSYYASTPVEQDRAGYAYERPYDGSSNGVPPQSVESYSREPSEHHYASSANGMDQDRTEDGTERMSSGHTGQKRKRIFANRTKTGCVTCRSRKKKCDEGRPQCNNCLRGGFTCLGYNSNTARPANWTKQSPQKPPILLQSKENDEQGQYVDQTITPVSANPSSADASQVRPNVAGDGHEQSRPPYAHNPATPADPRPPYPPQQQHQPQQQWPQHPPPQHGPSPQSAYPSDQLPPLSELARPDSQQQRQPSNYTSTPQREMSRPSTQSHSTGPAPNPPSSAPTQWSQQPPQPQPPSQQPQYHQGPSQQQSASQQQSDYPRSRPWPSHIDTQHAPRPGIPTANTATANTATSSYSGYEPKPGSKVFLTEDVERSRMLRGAPYNYFDPTLKNERQRCANALLRYNNACQLGSGISEKETQNMLMKVFDPKQDNTHSFSAPCRIEGHLGPGVKIEPGFRCTYGYNLRISDNVFIGENTRIDDAARVEIGARTWIGSDVTIITNSPATDMVQRKGADAHPCSAQPVSIGPECVVGVGARIYPGVKLGRGSTVEPFAIVKRSLGDFMTQEAAIGAAIGGGGQPQY